MLICLLIVRNLSTFQNPRLFSSERKAAPIYAILARSVLHIYAAGLYNYTFHPFAVTFPPVRVHNLYCPSAEAIVDCLQKLRRPCAHGRRHLCTHTSHLLSSSLRTLHIYTKKHLSQSLLLRWNREKIDVWDLLLWDVKNEEHLYFTLNANELKNKHWIRDIKELSKNR